MNPSPPERDASEQITELIETLHRTGKQLEDLTAGEVDAVADQHGHMFLLQHAQEQLRHTDATRQAAILNALPAHIAVIDHDGQITSVNKAWREFADANGLHSPGHTLGNNYLAICDLAQGDDAADAHRAAQGIRSVMATESESFSMEYQCNSPGETRWFLLMATQLVVGHAVGAVVMHMNITERKLSEDALRAGAQTQRLLADQVQIEHGLLIAAQRIAKIGSWKTDLSTSKVAWSPEMHRIFETDPATFSPTYQGFLELVHAQDRARVDDAYAKSLTRHTDSTIQHRLQLPNGRIKYVEARWQVAFDEQENAIGATGSCQDITERQWADDLVRQSLGAGIRKQARRVFIELGILVFGTASIYALGGWYDWFGAVTHWALKSESQWDEAIVAAFFLSISLGVFAFRRMRDSQASLIDQQRVQGALRLLHDDLDRQVEQRTGDLASANQTLGEEIARRKEQEYKITRLSRIRAVIAGVSSAMLRLHNRGELLQEACRIATTHGVFPMAWISEIDQRTSKSEIVAWQSVDQRSRDLIVNLNLRKSWPETDRPSYRALHAARPIIVNDVATDPTIAPIRDDLLRHGYQSVAAFPLFVDTQVTAVLVLPAVECSFFDAEEIALLQWLTADLSFALEHIHKSQQLDYLAYYDALTGLPNLQLFRDRLDQLIHSAKLEYGKVCVVVVDLEHFTHINDTLGRDAGDELLRQVGARFQEFLIEPYTLGHIGADTFAAAGPLGDEIIPVKYERMVHALKQPFSVNGREVTVAMQAGIAMFPEDGGDGASVFKNAEVALKLAKSSAERFTYHSSEVHARVEERLALEKQLRIAVEAQQFVLYYQPKIDMISGELVGAEALIRWQHPDKGLIAPGGFITLAEETGLIVPIGSWVINTVCAQQAAWIAANIAVVPIAVNISSAQFEKGDLLRTVRHALTVNSLNAKLLDLELTESAVMNDLGAATLKDLRKLGVGLALDDFGTGYSSLAHLKRLPFNSVKIDRSFVTEITQNAEDAAITTAIIAMAHSLNLKVVAEGVETQGQFNYLLTQACDEMQGNFFRAAVPREEFETDLRSGRRMELPTPSPAEERTLLLVDDEPSISKALTRMLRRDGYRILTALSGAAGLELLAINRVQVIISDQRMPGMSGTEFLYAVKQLYPDTVRIILSGYTDLEVVTESVNRGAVFKFLTKPWDDDSLREQVRDAFRRYPPKSS